MQDRRVVVARVGSLVESGDPWEPYRLVDPDGITVVAVSAFLADLHASGRSVATLRSYGMDLLRWFRFLRSLFPRGIGDLLGLEFPAFPSGAHKKIQLMGRDWPAVTAEVDLLLRPFDDMGWSTEVDFVLDEGLPFALLGFEGFLNRWAVSFNGYLGYVVVEPADDFDHRQPPAVQEQLRLWWPDLFS